MAGGGAPGASVVSRVLAALQSFDDDHRTLTLSELSRRSGLSLTTTHRLAAELAEGGLLTRGEDGRYQIGRRLWEIGTLASIQRDLRDVALPHLQDLHRTTGETVHLAVRDGLFSLYVERIVGGSSAKVLSRTGARLPLHATAVGKVLLADAPADVVRAALTNPKRVTARTIVEPGRLTRELSQARRRGFARTQEEMTLGAWSVAVPLGAGDGSTFAALGIVVGNGRKNLVRLAPVLQLAARAIARDMRPNWAE